MAIIIARGGTYMGATSHTEVLRGLSQAYANLALNQTIASGLTDSSGGTPATVFAGTTQMVNVANSGSNLAGKTATEASLNLVKDAILELATKANAMAAVTGTRTITYNGGGTAADGTIAAITDSGVAGTTGVQASNINATTLALDNALYNVLRVVNALCHAAGVAPLRVTYNGNLTSTVAAITVGGGTAASPGVTKAAMDAVLVAYANAIAAAAAKINAVRTLQAPKVIAE